MNFQKCTDRFNPSKEMEEISNLKLGKNQTQDLSVWSTVALSTD